MHGEQELTPRRRESGLVQRLRRSLDVFGGAVPGRILVGFSGGADSLALLSLLVDLGRHSHFEVRAVHVDHGVRPGSAAEAERVIEIAAQLGVAIDVRRISNELLDAHPGVGREEAMRRERYRAFVESAVQVNAQVIALAHHQRDQAETVLLHLLRGSGLRGVAGMRQVTEMVVPWWTSDLAPRAVTIWRPLLGESAGDVRAVAESLGFSILDDPSNLDTSFRRNAVRRNVLPVLELEMPGATANLARFAELAGGDSDELDAQARNALLALGESITIDRAVLLAYPISIRRRVVQFWIARYAPAGLEVSLNRVDEVLRVASVKERTRIVEIGLGCTVEISGQSLTVHGDC